jgi:rhamnosyltransferase
MATNMIKKEKLYGIVILYNPSDEDIQKIESYINDVKQLIVIDNSMNNNSPLLTKFYSSIIYVPNFENKGVASALNQACEIAIAANAEWALTMDQDSHFDQNGVSELIKKANQYPEFDKVAIFSPHHQIEDSRNDNHEEYIVEEKVMMSGNLLSLKALKVIGNFREEFFIDFVDTDFCFRVNKAKFKVITINTVNLNHYLGDARARVKFLWLNRVLQDHNHIRRYYIARNTLYMMKLYPERRREFFSYLVKQFKRILLYDNNQKWLKLRFMLKGVRDYRRKIIGPLRNYK